MDNTSDPCKDNPAISQEEANRDRTVYLISDHDAYDDKALARWIKGNCAALFASELEGWYTDEALWPQKRTLKFFHEWFEVECHSLIETPSVARSRMTTYKDSNPDSAAAH